jgi:1-acyl-sn-glycerol-3-phosphate acyltransferase
LTRGCSLIIWPEGHRSRDGRLRRFKNGAFQLALATGRPIVPVCILGSRKMMPPGSRLLTPARIRMILLPPIMPVGDPADPVAVRTLRKTTRDAIARVLAEQDEALPGKLLENLAAPECETFSRTGNGLPDTRFADS